MDAAIKSAEVLGEDTQWLQAYRTKLVDGVNGLWDEEKNSYPDSIRNDGKISNKTSMHTSFLSLNYDIVPEQYKADAINNILNPPEPLPWCWTQPHPPADCQLFATPIRI